MILLVTEQHDLTADLVVGRLRELSAPHARLNVDRLLSDVFLNSSIGGHGFTDEGGVYHDLAGVRTIFYRSHGGPQADPKLERVEAQFARREALAHLLGVLFSLDTRWVNHPAANWQASQKIWQLHVARRLGFRTPRTLVTRRPAEATAFVRGLSGPAIAKPVTFGSVGSGENERAIYTSRIRPDEDFADVALAPVIVQEEVTKRRDIRVTVLGDQAIAVAIESQATSETETDWRVPSAKALEQHVVKLPRETARRCVEITRALGLIFGAIDLIEEPDGGFCFLEINPAGQWGWLELEAQADILTPFTQLLMDSHG